MRRRYQLRYIWLFTKAAALASAYAAQFALRPYRRIAPQLGRCVSVAEAEAAEAATRLTQEQAVAAKETRWIIGYVLRCAPFRIWCVPQALTAKALLGRRAPWVVYIGYEKGKSVTEGQTKHAWLLSGDVRVTGYPEALSHSPIAGYLAPGALQPDRSAS